MTSETKQMLHEVLMLSKDLQEKNYSFAKDVLSRLNPKNIYIDLYNKDCVDAMRIFCFIYERKMKQKKFIKKYEYMSKNEQKSLIDTFKSYSFKFEELSEKQRCEIFFTQKVHKSKIYCNFATNIMVLWLINKVLVFSFRCCGTNTVFR